MAAPAECASSAAAAIYSGVTGTFAFFLTESPEPVTAQVINTALVNIAADLASHAASAMSCNNSSSPSSAARGARQVQVAVVAAAGHDSSTAVLAAGRARVRPSLICLVSE